MQTLYGIRCSDRFKVTPGINCYVARFDGEYIGTAPTGRAAVQLIAHWLVERQKRREAEEAKQAEQERLQQVREDNIFLINLAKELNVELEKIEQLFEIFKRRLEGH
jgi:hypothetical protein